MSQSRFEQLKEVIDTDYTNTYAYLEEVFSFIRELGHKLATYLGCDQNKIFILDSGDKRIQIDKFIQDSVIFDDGFFKFTLLVSIVEHPFNINNCGKSFFQKSLTPPSGVFLTVWVKYIQNKLFTVKSPGIKERQVSLESIDTGYEFDLSDLPQEIIEQSFIINPDDNASWSNFLESSFQAMKVIVESNLEQRINNLSDTKISQLAFGFRLDNSIQSS